jgi:uncharacterized membrane protein
VTATIVVLLGAFVLGIVSGLRTFTSPAVLFLARGGLAGDVLAGIAVAELIGDLLPQTPSRKTLPALVARLISGGFVGWMFCTFIAAPAAVGAVLGIIGAVIGTYRGAAARAFLIEKIGRVPAALAEDVVAIAAAGVVVFTIGPGRPAS